jgi:uncharacterized NAD(P)/FAD-binding protein YdhS
MIYQIAIIGCGLTGTAILNQLVRKIERAKEEKKTDPSQFSLFLIEKNLEFGPGYPHSVEQALPIHLLNQKADRMSIFFDAPDDFVEWIREHPERIKSCLSSFENHFPDVDFKPSGENYFPRILMGDYLKQRFAEAVESGRNLGIKIVLFPACEVVIIDEEKNSFSLTLKKGKSGKREEISAQVVVLATGHWTSAKGAPGLVPNPFPSRFFPSPWPARRLKEEIPADASVAVMGTGLSAIDAVLTLTSSGWFKKRRDGAMTYEPAEGYRQIVMYSRNGLLPRVRGKTGEYRNRYFTWERLAQILKERREGLRLDDLFSLLDQELEWVYRRPFDWLRVIRPADPVEVCLEKDIFAAVHGDGDSGELLWQTVLHQIFGQARELYLCLKIEERIRFDKAYRTFFFNHAAPMPVVNAQKMLALIKAGRLKIVKLGSEYDLDTDRERGYFRIGYRNESGRRQKDEYRCLIDARGQTNDYATCPSALARYLIHSGLVEREKIKFVAGRLYEQGAKDDHFTKRAAGGKEADHGDRIYVPGGVRIDPVTHEVLSAAASARNRYSKKLFAAGAMTGGQIIDASNASSSAESADRITDNILSHVT